MINLIIVWKLHSRLHGAHVQMWLWSQTRDNYSMRAPCKWRGEEKTLLYNQCCLTFHSFHTCILSTSFIHSLPPPTLPSFSLAYLPACLPVLMPPHLPAYLSPYLHTHALAHRLPLCLPSSPTSIPLSLPLSLPSSLLPFLPLLVSLSEKSNTLIWRNKNNHLQTKTITVKSADIILQHR